MIMEAFLWYVESLSAFWANLAGGGILRLALIVCLIYWIFCRGKSWRWCCRCSQCECGCGDCSCGSTGHDGESGDAGYGDEDVATD